VGFRITCPVSDYTGQVGAVAFIRGVAVVDTIPTTTEAYMRQRGYHIESTEPDVEPEAPSTPIPEQEPDVEPDETPTQPRRAVARRGNRP
jgi:hypothetical protein